MAYKCTHTRTRNATVTHTNLQLCSCTQSQTTKENFKELQKTQKYFQLCFKECVLKSENKSTQISTLRAKLPVSPYKEVIKAKSSESFIAYSICHLFVHSFHFIWFRKYLCARQTALEDGTSCLYSMFQQQQQQQQKEYQHYPIEYNTIYLMCVINPKKVH